MKKILCTIAGMIFILSGCVSMPDEVPENYLKNKTPEQEKSLQGLKDAIIKQRADTDKAAKSLKQAEDKITFAKQEITILKKDRSTLLEQEKLYAMEVNEQNLAAVKEKIKANDAQTVQKKAQIEYLEAQGDCVKAQSEVKDAELAVLVADLLFQRATIARAYLVKADSETAAEKKEKKVSLLPFLDSDKKLEIDIERYSQYLAKTKESLEKKKAGLAKRTEELKRVEARMKQSGVEVSK